MSAAVALVVNNDAKTFLAGFDTDAPEKITSLTRVQGLQKKETLQAIDYRPITGTLYGLGSGSRLYSINARTGEATQIGDKFAVPLVGDSFDMDFNPTVDRIRVVSNADQNLRLNPDTGAVVDFDPATAGIQPDVNLAYDAGDVNAGDDPIVVAAAYTKNLAGSTVTTLYGLDSGANTLVRQGGVDGPPSPNNGQLFTVGALGVNIGKRSSLDIETSGSTEKALGVFQVVGSSRPQLYSINLSTGQATLVGAMGIKRVVDFAIAPPREIAVGLTSGRQRLVVFDAADPSHLFRNKKIRDLDDGERLLALDYRPATGVLYGLSSENRVVIVNPKNGRTTPVARSDLNPALNGNAFGFDFNPTVDRIRVVSDADQNLRINPDTGAVVDADPVAAGIQPDGTLAFAAGDVNAGVNPMNVAAAYTFNDNDPATGTTLFGLDSNLNVLVTQVPPNNGTLNTIGALGVNFGPAAGFDIVTRNGNNYALAALQPEGQTRSGLYGINLTNGAAMRIGTIGGGRAVFGLALIA